MGMNAVSGNKRLSGNPLRYLKYSSRLAATGSHDWQVPGFSTQSFRFIFSHHAEKLCMPPEFELEFELLRSCQIHSGI